MSALKTTLVFIMLAQVSPAEASRPFTLKDRPPHTLTRPQTVVLNDGKYALIDAASVNDRNKAKSVEVTCPKGMKASGSGEPPDFRVILSGPTDNGTGWVAYAMFDGSGNVGPGGVYGFPAPFAWELRIRLVCATFG